VYGIVVRVITPERMKCIRYIACMGKMRNACKILFRKQEGKRPLKTGWIFGK
jgi:hypothetical protein